MFGRYRLQTFADQPDKVFLGVAGRRYWIGSAELFERCGFQAEDVAPTEEACPTGPDLTMARQVAALIHLQGEGIEIGALHCPSLLAADARAVYVDYIDSSRARDLYPDLEGLVDVDIVDDGESLAKVADGTLDFIVANHFLEHARNPLGVLRAHLRKVRPGGVLMYALPDKRFTFDHTRPITPFDHLVIDDLHGPHVSDRAHYLEFARHVDRLADPAAVEAHAKLLAETDNRIHFHVWDAEATRDFFERAGDYVGGLELVDFIEDAPETLTVLRRSAIA